MLQEKYPDLQLHIDRWRNERLVSKSVNTLVDDCHFSHSCGCCNDSPLFAWCYLKDGDTEIYSDPPNIAIGEKNPYPIPGTVYKPERAYGNWEESMRQNGLSEVVIERARTYLEATADLGKLLDDDKDDYDPDFD